MRWDCGDVCLFAQVPYFDCVIVSTSCEVVAGVHELQGDHLALVTLESQDALACAEIPEMADAVEVTACEQGTILVKRKRVNRRRMALLQQELLLSLNIPETPSVVM